MKQRAVPLSQNRPAAAWPTGFAPRALGVLMAAGCFAYLLHGTWRLFLHAVGELPMSLLYLPTVGELWAIVWLLRGGPATTREAAP